MLSFMKKLQKPGCLDLIDFKWYNQVLDLAGKPFIF